MHTSKEGDVDPKITPEAAHEVAKEAFLMGAPLVLVSIQADYLSHVTEPTGLRAPVNQFAHARAFVDASNRAVVGFNVDNLYTFAVLDLSAEPIVMSMPPMGDRYWIMQLIDAWNGVPGAPGARTHGGQGGHFLIAGPGWDGDVPDDIELIRCPTSIAMIGGRTYCSGPADYATVNALQDRYRLTPLSRWGGEYAPPRHVPLDEGSGGDTLVNEQFMALGPERFYERLLRLMVDNPAAPEDAPVLEQLKELGLVPGDAFDLSAFPDELAQAIALGYEDGRAEMAATARSLGEMVNGWSLAYDIGRYGTRYAYRAAWTFVGLGGNLLEDAFYPTTVVSEDGSDLDGAHSYELTFAADQIPPAKAFWSLTMYDIESYLVPNKWGRYALGDRSRMTYAADGSLTILMQRDHPGPDNESNWLPAPEGRFRLALRLYIPDDRVIDRRWVPPPVRKVA